MNGTLNVKTIVNFDHTPLFSSVGQWPFPREIVLTNCTSNLLLVIQHNDITYHCLLMKSIW